MDFLGFLWYKLLITGGILVLYGFLYWLTNRYQLFTPKKLKNTTIDQAIPYKAETVYLYISFYGELFVGLILAPALIVFHNMSIAFIAAIVIFTVVYVIYPTRFRPRIPKPNCHFSDLVHLIRRIDNPLNCCPSSHVTLSMLIGIVYLVQEYYTLAIIFLVWGFSIAFSVLTVKQHAFIDFVSGLILATVCGVGVCLLI